MMTCPHQYRTPPSSFAALNSLWAPSIHPSLLSLSSGNHRSFTVPIVWLFQGVPELGACCVQPMWTGFLPLAMHIAGFSLALQGLTPPSLLVLNTTPL